MSTEPQSIPGLTEGRIVHYVLPDTALRAGQHRPAIIVQVWDHGTGMSNLQVFNDGRNDEHQGAAHWVGSVYFSEDPKPGTWHYIEKA